MFDSDVIIQGGPFRVPTTLSGILEKRMNITYGRNGSGKSTIARAFREQQPDRKAISPKRDFSLSFDRSGNLDPAVCEHLFVFNEDFIYDNVRISGGLKSIVRIGASAELDAPIQDARNKIKDYTGQLNPVRTELETLNGSASTPGSINEADKKLKDNLKKAGGFSERLNRIEGRSCNLTQTILSTIESVDINDKLSDSISAVALQLEKSIDRYVALKSATNVIWNCPDLDQLPDIAEVNDVLVKTVRPSDLTNEEQAILDELSELLSSEDVFARSESLIVKSQRTFCPLCHQPLSAHSKDMLEQRLTKFRDKAVQDFKDKVNRLMRSMVSIDSELPSFKTNKYNQDIDNAAKKLQEVNSFVDDIKRELEKKSINTITGMPPFDQKAYDSLITECKDALSRVSEDVDDYNKTLDDERISLKREIDQLNIRLAYHENKSWIDKLNARIARRDKLNSLASDLNGMIQEQKEILDSLTSKIDQVDDAREQINKYLDFIFGVNKLRLVTEGKDQYKLQIKQGETYVDIPPKAISSGERNALALAYFFACVMEKKDKNYNYSDPTLLVIDDPVSSFDSENKAGVLSLLTNQIKKVLKGNGESKVLIMTHDYTTLRELCDFRSNFFSQNPFQTSSFNKIRYDHRFEKDYCAHIVETMEYGSDFWSTFRFAEQKDPDNYDGIDGIGNIIRRFAESYASRMYKCNWNRLFNDDNYTDCLPDNCKDNICNYAIRSVLNSESHGTLDEYSPTEIQRTARALLTFIICADEMHLRAYLVNKKEEESRLDTIRGWFGVPKKI